jgi:uncharacterized protein (TIRG00374 family)
MTQDAQETQARGVPWGRILLRTVFLVVGAVSLYYLLPQILEVFEQAPKLEDVQWRWFFLMAGLMIGAFVALWELTRIAVPGISWFVASTSQLTANAMVKITPGGIVAGGAFYFRMLAVSGVPLTQAAAALAAIGLLSNLVLFALPAVALVIAAISAPIPQGMLPVAIAGTVLFVAMFTATVVLVRYDAPLHAMGRVVETMIRWSAKRFKRDWTFTETGLVESRDLAVKSLGERWQRALGFAVLNWLLDYATLVAALFAIGAEPRVSLVLLAFAGAAVLGMIPITPGGLGFVEAGLVGMLTVAGIPASDALLATLAYRLFQFWLPIPAGLVAYIVFRLRYGKLSELPEVA